MGIILCTNLGFLAESQLWSNEFEKSSNLPSPVGEPECVPHLGNILEHFERREIRSTRERSANGPAHVYGTYRYAPLTEADKVFFKHLDSRHINEIHTRHIEHAGFHG